MSTASKVAEDKLNHPWKFCPVKRCLWKTGDGSYCPRHINIVGPLYQLKGENNGRQEGFNEARATSSKEALC